MLKFVTEMGARIVRIHKVLRFKQSPFMKKFIDVNTELRKKAQNDVEGSLMKLMSNCELLEVR